MNGSAFQDPGRSGLFYLAPSRRAAAEAAAGAAGLRFAEVKIGRTTKEEVLRELGQALHFPAWYGTNLDALYDCLTGPDWQSPPVLFISGLDCLCHTDSDAFSALIEVLGSAIAARQESGAPLWIMLDTAAAGLPSFPAA